MYGKLISDLSGVRAEETFARDWLVGVSIEQLTQWKVSQGERWPDRFRADSAPPTAPVATEGDLTRWPQDIVVDVIVSVLIVMVFERLGFLGPLFWLESHLDVGSVQARAHPCLAVVADPAAKVNRGMGRQQFCVFNDCASFPVVCR